MLAAGTFATGARANDEVDAFRTKIEKWVETRRILSEEQADWKADSEALRATRDLLRAQKQALEEEIGELEASNTAADSERSELLLERGEIQRANRSLEEKIRAIELEILALAPQLPAPLRQKLDLLLVQIPEDPEVRAPALGQRLMNVLGVLAQAEKFDSTATFVGETRKLGGDERVQVRTLYWGLSNAIYVDSQGKSAGIGRPGADGWTFEDRPDLAADASHFLDIYEGNVDAVDFVELPVEIESRPQQQMPVPAGARSQ